MGLHSGDASRLSRHPSVRVGSTDHGGDYRHSRRRSGSGHQWRDRNRNRHDRGTVYVTKTNDSGIFNFTQVPIGTYEVKVEASGFQTAVQSHLTLVLNQTARLEFKMSVGAVTNTVQVTSEAPLCSPTQRRSAP